MHRKGLPPELNSLVHIYTTGLQRNSVKVNYFPLQDNNDLSLRLNSDQSIISPECKPSGHSNQDIFEVWSIGWHNLECCFKQLQLKNIPESILQIIAHTFTRSSFSPDQNTKQDKKVTAVKNIIPGFVINMVSKLEQHT